MIYNKIMLTFFLIFWVSGVAYAEDWILERKNIRTVTLDLSIVENDIVGIMKHKKTNVIIGRLYMSRGGTVIAFMQKGEPGTPGAGVYISSFSGKATQAGVYEGHYYDVEGRSGTFKLKKN